MLRIVNFEEIQRLLLQIPSLVDLHEQRDNSYVQKVKDWLSQFETALNSNRMTAAGNLAGLRGLLISAERGVVPEGVQFHGRYTRRKIQEAAASFVVREAGDLVGRIIKNDGDRISEADRLGRQLVAIAKAKGVIKNYPRGTDFTAKLMAIWRIMSEDQELSPGVINIEGLVGPKDALVVLDRAMTRDLPEAEIHSSG